MASLTVNKLAKSFRSNWTFRPKPALQNISFHVQEGDLFGLLGHNGAGKTTTIKIILDLIRADSGEVLLNGEPLKQVSQRKGFGYLPELPYFYDHLTVEETLQYLGGLAMRGSSSSALRQRIDRTLQTVGLADRSKSRVRSLSKGLQQRLGLAQAIINHPSFLILDEPFSGLDPLGRSEFRKIIQELNSAGTTILISSHILSDVQQLSNRVAIIANGEVRQSFSLADRAQLFGQRKLIRFQATSTPEQALLTAAHEITTMTTHNGEEYTLTFEDEQTAAEVLQSIIKRQTTGSWVLLEYRSEPKNLEEIFLEVTKSK